jgi:hypothetical protein
VFSENLSVDYLKVIPSYKCDRGCVYCYNTALVQQIPAEPSRLLATLEKFFAINKSVFVADRSVLADLASKRVPTRSLKPCEPTREPQISRRTTENDQLVTDLGARPRKSGRLPAARHPLARNPHRPRPDVFRP